MFFIFRCSHMRKYQAVQTKKIINIFSMFLHFYLYQGNYTWRHVLGRYTHNYFKSDFLISAFNDKILDCKTYLIPIATIQRKAIRLILSLPYSQDLNPVFEEFEILPFGQLLYFFTALFIFKYRKGLLPNIFHTLYDFPHHDYHTRGQSLMNIPPCHSTMAQRCLRYIGAKVGNILSTKVEWKCSFHSFKANLKKRLLKNPILKI